uniref:Uncharacterized protein n=1 Tax=Fagus sylvatica TaxID=28930 RepID=A0A2N9IYJ5_FAGSY
MKKRIFAWETKVQTTAQSNTPPPTKVEQIASAEEEELNDDYDLEYSAATRPSKGKQRVIDEATQNPSFNPVVAIDEPMPNATILFRQEDIISQVTDEGIPAQVEEDIVKVEPSMGFPEEDHSFTDLVEFRRTKFNATNPITAEFIAAELVLFMEKFDKEEYNGQPPEHFWIWTGSFDDFIQFKVPSEGLPLLIQLKERYGDFMAGFQFGATTGSFMLSMLCAILLDMQNSFVGNIDEVRLLEWRGVVRELMKAGFAVGFILDHLRDMARAVFNQRAKGVIENLNTQIVDLKKTFTELEFRRDQLVAGGLAPTIPSAYSRISDGLLN